MDDFEFGDSTDDDNDGADPATGDEFDFPTSSSVSRSQTRKSVTIQGNMTTPGSGSTIASSPSFGRSALDSTCKTIRQNEGREEASSFSSSSRITSLKSSGEGAATSTSSSLPSVSSSTSRTRHGRLQKLQAKRGSASSSFGSPTRRVQFRIHDQSQETIQSGITQDSALSSLSTCSNPILHPTATRTPRTNHESEDDHNEDASQGSGEILCGAKRLMHDSTTTTSSIGKRGLGTRKNNTGPDGLSSDPLRGRGREKSMPRVFTSKRTMPSISRTRPPTYEMGSTLRERYLLGDRSLQEHIRLDDCLYLCQTLLNHEETASEKTAFHAASELALLLSRTDTRRELFLHNTACLKTILDVYGSCYCGGVPRPNQWDAPGLDSMRGISQSDPSMQSYPRFSRRVMDALTLGLYFVSLDCTLSEEGAPGGIATHTRLIRHAILSHPSALRGILYLVVHDPLIARLRVTSASPTAAPSTPGSQTSGRQSPCHHEDTRDNMSSPSTCVSEKSIDPTKLGRLRRKRQINVIHPIGDSESNLEFEFSQESSQMKRRRIVLPDNGKLGSILSDTVPSTQSGRSLTETYHYKKTIQPNIGSDDLSLTSEMNEDSTESGSIVRNIETTIARMLVTLSCHSVENGLDGTTKSNHFTKAIHIVPVLSLKRILSGKLEWSDKSCLDDEIVPSNGKRGNGFSLESRFDPIYDEDGDDSNPLIQTNELLGESGALPLLSQALAETLAAAIDLLRFENHVTNASLVAFLHDRVSSLASIVDEACLFSDSNRLELSENGYTSESGGSLVVGLLKVVQCLLETNRLFKDDNEESMAWSDVGLVALRTLTSMTHENSRGARELANNWGINILAQVLQHAVNDGCSSQMTKIRYDSIIFCLNTLTNCVESYSYTANELAMIEGSPSDADPTDSFLAWMTKWLVTETQTFGDVVFETTHGTCKLNDTEGNVENNENENLVTAGNGFVLLACLLIHERPISEQGSIANLPREPILNSLPGDILEAKLAFVKKILSAFCNFYRFSIGDLSVAVTSPIRRLATGLDKLLAAPDLRST